MFSYLYFHPDCQALFDDGYKESGIYTIHHFQNDDGMKVFCEMTNQTGWIVSKRFNKYYLLLMQI